MWTKSDELKLINKLQDHYINELIMLMESTNDSDAASRHISLTSPTGTGKTKMMAKLINRYPKAFFIVTTLSKGQLNQQIQTSLQKDCLYDNFIVYGAMSLKTNSILTEKDIYETLPDTDIYWIRDEGHINTNKWMKALESKCKKIINFSATNKIGYGVVCDFTETMMLRTVHQTVGVIDDALSKLLEIKKQHSYIADYNPCALFRVITSKGEQQIIEACQTHNLSYITLVDNDDYSMKEICEDNNKYDVIINKQKVVEGIDIRRAHVLWMEGQPKNPTTIIQSIGRCRRNALLWRQDIDILHPDNKELLKNTRQCFVYYNRDKLLLPTDINGELQLAFCPIISIERLKTNHEIYVEDGIMANGLTVAELQGKTGWFNISKDADTGFNVVNNPRIYETKLGLYPAMFPEVDSLVDKLCDKDSLFFQNLTQTLAPYFNGNPLYDYTLTVPAATGNDMHPTQTLSVYRGVTPDGVLEIQNVEVQYTSSWRLGWIDEYIVQTKHYHDQIHLQSVYNKIREQHSNELTNDGCEKVIGYNDPFGSSPTSWVGFQNIAGKITYFISIKTLSNLLEKVSKGIIPNKEKLVKYLLFDMDSTRYDYTAVYNNKLIAMLGMEVFEQRKKGETYSWTEQKSVTKLMDSNTKLYRFIDSIYSDELAASKPLLFTGDNNFNFPKKANSCLGFCVEYYAKLLLTKEFANQGVVSDAERVRLCMEQYRETMEQHHLTPSYTLSLKTLQSEEFKPFVSTVIQLGEKAAQFISSKIQTENMKSLSTIFATEHIVGVPDFLDKHTILDLKCTNYIDSKMIRQVLAYHFLSTYREDFDIQHVIVYDVVSGKSVEINITPKRFS